RQFGVERQLGLARLFARLAPRRAEAVRCPWPAVGIDQDDGAALFLGRLIERDLERSADRNLDTSASLGLAQADVRAVEGRPRQPQQIALPLSSPQCQQQR